MDVTVSVKKTAWALTVSSNDDKNLHVDLSTATDIKVQTVALIGPKGPHGPKGDPTTAEDLDMVDLSIIFDNKLI